MIIFLLEPFSFFNVFVIFSSLFYMFSAPRIRQLDKWCFISLYYYLILLLTIIYSINGIG